MSHIRHGVALVLTKAYQVIMAETSWFSSYTIGFSYWSYFRLLGRHYNISINRVTFPAPYKYEVVSQSVNA